MLTIEAKAARIARAEQHVAADRLVSGMYLDSDDHSIGSSVGCDAIDIAGWKVVMTDPDHEIKTCASCGSLIIKSDRCKTCEKVKT